jgi:phosphatidate cytidylyltransferase
MKRVVPGILMALAWGALLFFAGSRLFWLVVAIGAWTGFAEYLRMTLPDLRRSFRIGCQCISLLPVLLAFSGSASSVLAGVFAALAGLIALVFICYTQIDDVLGFLSRVGFGILYIGICAAHLVFIRNLSGGVAWLAVLTAVTIGSDTGAYYAGRRFGRTKLCPRISPGKTVAGAIGGLGAGSLAAGLTALILPSGPGFLYAFGLGLVLVPVGIVGDLTESIIKRATGSKDSGTILAGHGGLLDRIDSQLLTAPVLYYLLLGTS